MTPKKYLSFEGKGQNIIRSTLYFYFGLHEVKSLIKIIGERSIKYTTTFFEWFIYHRQFCLSRIITFIY